MTPGTLIVTLTVEQLTELVERAVHKVLTERRYALEEEQLTKEQCAALLGVTSRTVHTYMAREGLPYSKGMGGRLVFRREDVVQWAHEHGIRVRGPVPERR